jgi:O-antigen/teichoic acid export membrane protein
MLTKGTTLVFIGQMIMTFFGFVGYVLIARHWTESDLGIYSLALTILSICTTISVLGLPSGIVRSIAHSRGKDETKKIPDFIATSVFYILLTSIILAAVLFFLSEEISHYIFHEPSLILPLKIFSIAIPFPPLINVITSIFRGFDQIKPTVYFSYIFQSMLFPISVGVLIIFNLAFINVFYVNLFSFIITFILILIYFIKKMSPWLSLKTKSIHSLYSKELILFSLPLLGTAVLGFILNSTDKLMLGGLKNAADVGLYSVAIGLSPFISFPLSVLVIVFIPVFSGLYARGLIDEMKRNYSILTKWICLCSLPLFMVFFLYPEPIIAILFGSNYVPAEFALRILSIAYIINNFSGPCGATLLALGRSQFIMFATLASAIINVIFNALLIPSYGLIGAAIATGISVVSINLLRNWKIYSLNKIQPLSKNLLKPTFLSIIIMVAFYLATKSYIFFTWWIIILLIVFFYITFIISILITKSLDEEDIKMLLAIEKKTGIKSTIIRNIISKFV